jgi:predicted nucleotidyltransferase
MRDLPVELNAAAAAVRAWAQSEPEVGPVWFYGSRITGKHRPDSDLDIALRSARSLTPDEVPACQARFIDWAATLSVKIGCAVHIQPRDASHVREAVEAYGVLVYEPRDD